MGILVLSAALVGAGLFGFKMFLNGRVCPMCGGRVRWAGEWIECERCQRPLSLWDLKKG